MISTIRKIGNSAGTIIPALILKKLHLTEGDSISIEEDEEKIVIIPIKSRPHYKLNDLLAQCDPKAPIDLECKQWDEASAVGNETW